METTRREFLAFGAGAVAFASGASLSLPAAAEVDLTAKAIAEFTGGKEPQAGKVELTVPEIAENGNTVPVAFMVDSEMTAESYVTDVLVLADGNPRPGVATFRFSPMSGEAAASTRIRLAKTQNVVAVARMNDGSLFMDKKLVKVTIGGCGG